MAPASDQLCEVSDPTSEFEGKIARIKNEALAKFEKDFNNSRPKSLGGDGRNEKAGQIVEAYARCQGKGPSAKLL